MLPVPFMAMWLQQRFDAKRNIETAKLNFDLSKDLKKLIFAVVVGVAAYVLVWYVPNRAEIAPMNHYYRVNQVQPHSVMHLMQNVQHAVVGDFRGVAPYLFRHTPVVFVLSLLGLAPRCRPK